MDVAPLLLDLTRRMLVGTPAGHRRDAPLVDVRRPSRRPRRAHLATTVIQGTLYASAPLEATGGPTAAMLANGTLVAIDGAGHGLYHGHVAECDDALLAAVGRCTVG